MHYRLAPAQDEAVAGILRETLAHLRKMPEMQDDLAKLGIGCCSTDSTIELRQAPQPVLLRSIPH